MPLDIESGLGGLSTGLLGTFLAAFGFSKRLDKIEKEIEGKVASATCNQCQEKNSVHFESINGKLDMLIEHSMNRRNTDG